MAEVQPTNEEVRSFRGLHLYHAGRSNCSARVRLLLEEKGLPWTSRHVDIYTRKNVTPEYFGVNPKGLVPTLVHDGRVIAESNDILLHLEDAFPEPGFTPAASADAAVMRDWLRRSGDIHMPGIKTFAYAKSHAKNVVKTPEEVALYRSLQKDPALLAFHGKHDLPGQSFTDTDVEGASALLRATLEEMDGVLSHADYLVGGAYSLADLSWAPSITTLRRVGFPVDDYAQVILWFERVAARPAWTRAIDDWARSPREGVVEMPARA
jgi:glutathione S-transferase